MSTAEVCDTACTARVELAAGDCADTGDKDGPWLAAGKVDTSAAAPCDEPGELLKALLLGRPVPLLPRSVAAAADALGEEAPADGTILQLKAGPPLDAGVAVGATYDALVTKLLKSEPLGVASESKELLADPAGDAEGPPALPLLLDCVAARLAIVRSGTLRDEDEDENIIVEGEVLGLGLVDPKTLGVPDDDPVGVGVPLSAALVEAVELSELVTEAEVLGLLLIVVAILAVAEALVDGTTDPVALAVSESSCVTLGVADGMDVPMLPAVSVAEALVLELALLIEMLVMNGLSMLVAMAVTVAPLMTGPALAAAGLAA